MAFEGTPKQKTLRSILEQHYQVDGKPAMNAVFAAEYFINLYENWRIVSEAIPSQEDARRLDLIMTGILSGEAMRNPVFTNGIADLIGDLGNTIKNQESKALMYNLIVSTLSGEILVNPFVMEHKERIGAAVFVDCLNESARHAMTGKGKEASDICRWQVMNVIGYIVSGLTTAMEISLNLKSAFSVDTGSQ